MLSEPMDFKEQMVEARRIQILMGAAQVFAQKGYHKATTREIAKAAGISEGTIYNYFSHKRELLAALIELVGAPPLKNIVVDNPPDEPKELFRAVLQDRYRLVQERGHFLVPILAEVFVDAGLRVELYRRTILQLTRYVEQYIQDQIEAGRFRQMDPFIVTRSLVGALLINAAFKLTELDPRYKNVSADAMVEQILSLFMDGLLADENDGD